MIIVKTTFELQELLTIQKEQGKHIGFVPTMGALHAGHLSLIEEAQKTCEVVVCSIFVNPTQFNDPADLERYPRPIERDIQLLKEINCSILFLPEVSEMYPDEEIWSFDLGSLEKIFEGAMRPGHFQGVTQIVSKLFHAVKPDQAFFGQKDLQQCKVIEKMIRDLNFPIQLVICPIMREKEGLAMSSRNVRLSETGRLQALALFKSLQMTQENFEKGLLTIQEMELVAKNFLNDSQGVELEYFNIVSAFDLETSDAIEKGQSYVALVAAWVEGVRLIDNLFLN